MALLETRDLTKSFGPNEVCKGINSIHFKCSEYGIFLRYDRVAFQACQRSRSC